MKKLFAVFLIFAAALFGVTACANQPSAETVNPPADQTVEDKSETPEQPDGQEITKMFITVNGNKLEVALADNPAAKALAERLKQGDVTYTAKDHGGFEKYGALGFSLPADDTYITAQAGDVMLYLGNQMVLFYGSNSWDYTRLGRINGYSASELCSLLGGGSGNVQVTISLK